MRESRGAPFWRPDWLVDLGRDLRYGGRSLSRRPGLTAVAVLTLGIGIGASVAMFSVLNLAFFQALPYDDAERLVIGNTRWPTAPESSGQPVSAPDYFDVRDQARSFADVGAVTPFSIQRTLTGDAGPERVPVALVSPGFFRMLGVRPAAGREFTAAEGELGAEPVALLSHELWQRRYGGDPDVVGSAITVDGTARTVVGVLPTGFSFVTGAELWFPMQRGGLFTVGRQFHNWYLVGRLADGVSVPDARAEVGVIMGRLAAEYPESNRDKGMFITPMREALTQGYRSSLLLVAGAIVLVLLIACGNVAGLLLARGSERRGEVALRTALGARRGRLIRQLLGEAAVLGLAAGAAGTITALLAQRSVVAATPLTSAGVDAAAVQPMVLLFAVVLTLLTVLVFGLAPAVAAARVDPALDLRSGLSTRTTGDRSWFRSGLVVAQVALSILLLAGAGLLTRSFLELRAVDPGFEPRGLVTAEVALPQGDYPEPERRIQFFRDLAERARALPGVEAIGLINRLPIRDGGDNVAVWDPADPPLDASEWRLAHQRTVLPGYFDAMGIPVVRGRDVGPEDVSGSSPVMVINETMARTLFPDQDALGRRVAVDGGDESPEFEVVGVVGDVYVEGLGGAIPMTMYFPHAQRALADMRLAVRHSGALPVESLRELLADMDPTIPLAGVRTMREVLAGSVAFARTITGALGAFAAVALFLAALGLYGVLAYHVARRRREIGIRVALGADGRDIVRNVVVEGLRLVAIGAGVGIPAALLGSRMIEGLLFQVGARDAGTFAVVIALLLTAALLACLVPALRALRVDPVVAFRAD